MIKLEISKSFCFGHLHTFGTLAGACNGIPIARNTAESTHDQIPQQFPKDYNIEAAAALTQFS